MGSTCNEQTNEQSLFRFGSDEVVLVHLFHRFRLLQRGEFCGLLLMDRLLLQLRLAVLEVADCCVCLALGGSNGGLALLHRCFACTQLLGLGLDFELSLVGLRWRWLERVHSGTGGLSLEQLIGLGHRFGHFGKRRRHLTVAGRCCPACLGRRGLVCVSDGVEALLDFAGSFRVAEFRAELGRLFCQQFYVLEHVDGKKGGFCHPAETPDLVLERIDLRLLGSLGLGGRAGGRLCASLAHGGLVVVGLFFGENSVLRLRLIKAQ